MWDAWQPAGHLGLWARQPMNLDLVWAALGLVAAILVGVIAIAWVQRWRKGSSELLDPQDELESYRVLFKQGLLSAEEWEQIRKRLEGNPAAQAPPNPPANGSPGPDSPTPPPGQE
jgi:hypothetical protein